MKDKIVLVTGGTKGIGAGIVEAFCQQGAQVIANYHSDDTAALALQEKFAEHVCTIRADVQTTAGRTQLLRQIIDQFGRIDVLVNNAGISARGSFLKGTEAEFDRIIDTNLKGPIFLAQACAKIMIEQQLQGSIINIASVSAHYPNAPTSYAAAKAGLVAASKTMAFKLGQHGIRVNTVTPGSIRSDMNRRVWQDNPELWAKKTAQLPLGRGGEPLELASAVVYLASTDASFITGAELVVDGGWSLRPVW